MIDLSDANQFYIFPISDLHYGSNWFNSILFEEWKQVFESTWENKCIYLLGDMIEFPTTRVNTYETQMATEDSINDIIEMFEPYKDYVRFVVSGNHEIRGKKDFNLDVTKIIAKQLDAKYTRNDFFDKLSINGNDFVIYGKHGTSVSKYDDLAMKNYKLDMGNVDANLYLQGHNHYLTWSQKTQRCFDGVYTKYYGFTGHFLRYKNSYAHNRGLSVSTTGFMRIGIDRGLNASCKMFRGDCGL